MSHTWITGNYGLSWELESEGNRFYLVSCLNCGATILITDDDDSTALEKHDRWHEKYPA